MFVLAGLGRAGEHEGLLDGVPRKLGDPLDGVCLLWGGSAARGVGRGGRAGVTTLQEAVTRGCCLCTIYQQNSKPATEHFSAAVSGELAREVKYLQVVKEAGSEVLRWDWDCLQRSPWLAKMLVLDFITVTGLHAFH